MATRVDNLDSSPSSATLKSVALGVYFTYVDFRFLSYEIEILMVPQMLVRIKNDHV